tara:strand:- start:12 stop:602 length:591 start_codon:yes stop_codon:yes gene_type:complete
MDEDAPANAAGGGNVAGLGIDHPDRPGSGEPGKKKKKTLIDRSMMDARTKAYKEHRKKLESSRVARLARKEARKSKFIEDVKDKTLNTEMAYGQGFDTAKPMADMSNINSAKSATGYELYHKDFSSAMQHAYKFAKSKGYTVDPKEIDNKVATGPKRPSKGKTNSYILGTDKRTYKAHIQVYNMDNKRYELNMYIS